MKVKKWLILLILKPFYKSFYKNLDNVEQCQNVVLNKIEKQLKLIKVHQKNESVTSFADLAITEYDYYQNYVEKDKKSSNNSIWGKAVVFEKTSGTTSGSKYIPYTRQHLSHFIKMMAIWKYDLIKSCSELKNCSIFISVSPPNYLSEKSSEDVKVIKNDDEYLPLILRFLLKGTLKIPNKNNNLLTSSDFDDHLLKYLMSQKTLEVISIWNPTYLKLYIDKLIDNYEQFHKEVNRSDLPEKLNYQNLNKLWPDLKIISCWGDANSEDDFYSLKQLFPDVVFQKKGLMSTEFPVSVPMSFLDQGHLPLVNHIYYEFKDVHGNLLKLNQVHEGQKYTLILSAPGAFFRYNTHDIIEIVGFYKSCPVFEFCGRDNYYSDLCGEKLEEQFVKKIVKESSPKSFSFLKACRKDQGNYYELITEDSELNVQRIEEKLKLNIHYKYALSLGQLKKLRLNCVLDSEKEFLEIHRIKGMKLGDIKKSYLVKL